MNAYSETERRWSVPLSKHPRTLAMWEEAVQQLYAMGAPSTSHVEFLSPVLTAREIVDQVVAVDEVANAAG